MLNLTPSSERDVRAVLKAINLDGDDVTPDRFSLWRSAWLCILCLRMRCVIDRRKAERLEDRGEVAS